VTDSSPFAERFRTAAAAALFVAAALSAGAQTSGDALGTTLLEDSESGIRLFHRWDLDDDPRDETVILAFPPSAALAGEAVRWELSSSITGETREYRASDDLPLAVNRLRQVSLREAGHIRHTRLVRLRLSPHQVMLDGEPWQVTGVEIAIPVSPEESVSIPDPTMRPLIERLVLNPEGVGRWIDPTPPLPPQLEPEPWFPETDEGRWIKVEVEQPGPVRIEAAVLVNGSTAVNLDRVQVVHRGEPVPVWIPPSRDAIIFVAPDVVETYSPRSAFWIDLAGSDEPARIGVAQAPPVSPEVVEIDPWVEVILEEDNPDPDAGIVEPLPRHVPPRQTDGRARRMVWTWQPLTVGEPASASLPVWPGPLGERTASAEVELRLAIVNQTRTPIRTFEIAAGDETVQASLDRHSYLLNQAKGELSARSLMSGPLTFTAQREVPGSAATESMADIRLDSIALRVPTSDLRGVDVDAALTLVSPAQAGESVMSALLGQGGVAIDVSSDPPVVELPGADGTLRFRGADRRLAVGRPSAFPPPASVTPWSPPTLRDATNRADLIIVTHPDLREAAEELAAHHREQGLAVVIAPVDAICDLYGAGIKSPDAIRAFLADAMRHWTPPAPSHVTLLGESSRDWHRVMPDSVADLVPTYSDPNPAARGVFWQASDVKLAQIAGDDSLADMTVGRLSAADPESALALVRKVIAYDSDVPLGPWRARLGFIADNDVIGSETFDEMSEELRMDTIGPALTADTVYLRHLPLVDNRIIPRELITDPLYEKVSIEATSRIRELFDEGALVATYFGHGGPNIWADERIWFGCDSPRSDNLMLEENPRLPFLVNMTCSSGAIDYPTAPLSISISEDFLRSPGGAIACYVPTGEGMPSHHRRLAAWLMDGIYNEQIRSVGAVTTFAGWRFILEDRGGDLIEHFVLLGDPAMPLALPDTVTHRPALEARAAGVEQEIHFNAPPETLFSAVGRVWIDRPDGSAMEMHEVMFAGNEVTRPEVFTIPADAPEGRWGLGALWWDEQAGKDELILSEFTLARARLAIDSIRVPTGDSPAVAGSMADVEVDLRSVTDVTPPPFTLALRDVESGRTVVESEVLFGTETLLPVTLSWPVSAGLHCLRLEASGPGILWTDESYLKIEEPIMLAVVNSVESGPDLATGPSLVRPAPLDQGAQHPTAVEISVGNIGGRANTEGLLTVSRRGGEPLSEAQTLPSLQPGQIQTLRVPFETSVVGSVGRTVNVDLRWTDPQADPPNRSHRTEADMVRPLADLAVSPHEYSVRPSTPGEGETIFVDCLVENLGQVVAPEVRVELNSASGQRLENRAESSEVTLRALRPGEARPVTLRWDPTANQGDQTIVVRVDRNRRVEESNESNNELTISLHVKTPEDVRFTQAVGHVNPQIDPPSITLTTQIANFGETDARDYVVTWFRDAEKTHRIGESHFPVVGGLLTYDVEFVWEFTPEEVRMQRQGHSFNPTCEVGLRASERRISVSEADAATP
jgi:hypothetical protein